MIVGVISVWVMTVGVLSVGVMTLSRHVAPLGHIILIPSQPVYALSP